MQVTVYTVAGDCQQCLATIRTMTRHGIEHTVASYEESPEIQQLATELGYTTAPVVVVESNGVRMSWCGYRPTNIKGLLQR